MNEVNTAPNMGFDMRRRSQEPLTLWDRRKDESHHRGESQMHIENYKVPKSFWGASVFTAYYPINKSPSALLGFDVLEKVWTGKEISYNHLKVFGCIHTCTKGAEVEAR